MKKKKVKDAADQLKPFFYDNGYFRKGNAFYKIEKCFMFMMTIYPMTGLAPCFQVIPLYYPYDTGSIPFGSELRYYKMQSLDFSDYCELDESDIPYLNQDFKSMYFKPMDFNEWIRTTERFYKIHIFPLLSRVSSLHQMKSFLGKGHRHVHEEWSSCTSVSYYKLRAYTHFVLGEYNEMQEAIERGFDAIDNFGVFDYIAANWKAELEILNVKKTLSEQEKREWLNGIVSNTLQIWLGKNWESIIKNKLVLPLDFSNC